MFLYLHENEVGYSAEGLGFPSIEGCHAIVFHGAKGLFGLHSFGGEREPALSAKAQAFGEFLRGFDITDRGAAMACTVCSTVGTAVMIPRRK